MSATQIQSVRLQHKNVKRNTRIFKQWLEAAAKASGWINFGHEGERTTGDIAAQIELVSNSQCEANFIPADVHVALRNAIEGRKTCKDFFQAKRLSTQRSTTEHSHFIALLEHALNVLPRQKREDPELHRDRHHSSTLEAPMTSFSSPVNDSEWHLVSRKRRRS
ncbi:uncharacterized protein F4807DRAFT_460780 [Annulohypoxylon truncatum]|uniref:uncharacterized protein n=1 Tax=Annulohypoxylon truncatum TaxID=327061 RepID=UPI002008B0D4|nr:uncharacterized protein F4807DRAFT_460780 [Annulohypoxylon truncatum]KAI1209563.1 hypothetical protein F4807DRAFT_460780 [Annulohypoxylon truncatum]